MSSEAGIIGWFNLMGWALMFIICAVMAFRETERKHTPDDNDKDGIIIDKSEMNFKRVGDIEKTEKMKKLKASSIPVLTILGIFGIVAASLRIMAKVLHITYNEINIIVYYLIIPLSWFIMLDYIIGLPITTPIWILLWVYIFWSKRKFFRKWCDVAFRLSVDFLLKFQRIGWNYWVASVIIGVVVPIIIYAALIILMVNSN